MKKTSIHKSTVRTPIKSTPYEAKDTATDSGKGNGVLDKDFMQELSHAFIDRLTRLLL